MNPQTLQSKNGCLLQCSFTAIFKRIFYSSAEDEKKLKILNTLSSNRIVIL